MEILSISKDKNIVSLELTSSELVVLTNALNNINENNKNLLDYKILKDLIIVRDLSQYGHLDEFALDCILNCKNKIEKLENGR